MRVLHIEDDNFIAELYAKGLKAKSIVVDRVSDADDALAAIDAMPYDAIILDLNLPGVDGMTFLERIRRRKVSVPVIVISSRNSLGDKVKALAGGADDYVAKPIQLEELAARLFALGRRPGRLHEPELSLGNLTFAPHSSASSVDGKPLPLSRRETLLLSLLLNHLGRPLTREAIGDRLYAFGEEVASNAVEVLIFRLRARLKEAGASVKIVSTRGIGYTLQADDGSDRRAAPSARSRVRNHAPGPERK